MKYNYYPYFIGRETEAQRLIVTSQVTQVVRDSQDSNSG